MYGYFETSYILIHFAESEISESIPKEYNTFLSISQVNKVFSNIPT